MSDSKNSVPFLSSKLSSGHNVAVASVSSDSTGPVQSHCGLQPQNKMSTSGLPVKSEKFNQSNSQTSPEVNYAASMHPLAASNGPAILTDEEVCMKVPVVFTRFPLLPKMFTFVNTSKFIFVSLLCFCIKN